jgi:hypothetical protein
MRIDSDYGDGDGISHSAERNLGARRCSALRGIGTPTSTAVWRNDGSGWGLLAPELFPDPQR